MRILVSLALSTVLLSLSWPAVAEGEHQRESSLDGVWKVVGAKLGDRELTPAEVSALDQLYVFAAGKLTVISKGKVASSEPFTADTAHVPYSLDILVRWDDTEFDLKEPLLGIFKVEGDRLSICSPFPSHNVRPKDLVAGEASRTNLVRLLRAKPARTEG